MPEEITLLDTFAERVRAFSDLVKSIGESKLKAAQSELTEAVAAGQLVRVRVLETVLDQLQTDLDAMNRARASARRRAQAVAEQAHAASMLLQGDVISAYSHARDAYKSFERQALVEADGSLFDLPFDPASASGTQFLNNRRPDEPCDHPPIDIPPANALQLMDWALKRQYIARTGTRAQQQFVALFRQIAAIASASLDAIRRADQDLRTRTYNVWQPVRILGVEPTPAEARVLAGTGQIAP